MLEQIKYDRRVPLLLFLHTIKHSQLTVKQTNTFTKIDLPNMFFSKYDHCQGVKLLVRTGSVSKTFMKLLSSN